MSPDTKKHLTDEKQSEFHDKMLRLCLDDVKSSRSFMSKFYPRWDEQDRIYSGERVMDEEDRKQADQGKPEKMVLPTTRAQIETYVAFLFSLFTQNDTPYELQPKGVDDFGTKWEDCESILQRDCSKSQWFTLVYQFVLDVGRFGLGVLETSWTKDVVQVNVPATPTSADLGGASISFPSGGGYKEFTKFLGNRVRNISPYRFFPDTKFPLRDFHKGRFCASEEDFSMGDLRKLESVGEVSGIKWIEPMPANFETLRGAPTKFSFGKFPRDWDNDDDSAPVCIQKHFRKIIPEDFKLDGKKPLGNESFPILYRIWIANDNRVIKCEPVEEWHQEFPYSLGQYTSDMHRILSLGLADVIYSTQEIMSWLLNAHVMSVSRVIQNRMILNPTLVNTKSYDGDKDIFMNKGFGRTDPRLAVAQLPAQDVTAGFMGEIEVLSKLADRTTGVNDNLQGQMNPGRRSAQENRVQTAGAASRLKMAGRILWETGLGRNGRLMLSNARQSLPKENFKLILGLSDGPELDQRYLTFQGTPEEIICGDDYIVFDSTLSSEKGFMAQQEQELLSLLLQANPAIAVQIAQSIDPMKLVESINYNRGGSSLARFKPQPGTKPIVAPQLLPPQPGAAQPSA